MSVLVSEVDTLSLQIRWRGQMDNSSLSHVWCPRRSNEWISGPESQARSERFSGIRYCKDNQLIVRFGKQIVILNLDSNELIWDDEFGDLHAISVGKEECNEQSF